jgi:epoxyqueuosine reductase QueG
MDADAETTKQALKTYAMKRGAAAFGIADAGLVGSYAPQGHRPVDLLPNVASVISIGVTGPTQGTWRAPAKVMTSVGANVGRIYRVAVGLSFHIEQHYGYRSIYCPPHVDPEFGARLPLQSLKLHAELAGTGARSLAGDILLHPDYGMLYYGSIFTEMPLPPDSPMARNPCPAPSCLKMYQDVGQTPCQKFCPVQCLSATLDDDGGVEESTFDMYRCAELCQQYENMPTMVEQAIGADERLEREEILYGAEAQSFFYKATAGVDTNAQCFECMRVCPIATQSPMSDPVRRGQLAREEAED